MRNVVVTGGSRGLGLGIARKLAAAGYSVIALARKKTDQVSAAIQEATRQKRGALHFVSFDLGEVEKIPDLVKSLRKEFGPIYGLVNNAALGTEGVDDVAHAVEFLLGDGAKNITGTVMTVDAGSTA